MLPDTRQIATNGTTFVVLTAKRRDECCLIASRPAIRSGCNPLAFIGSGFGPDGESPAVDASRRSRFCNCDQLENGLTEIAAAGDGVQVITTKLTGPRSFA